MRINAIGGSDMSSSAVFQELSEVCFLASPELGLHFLSIARVPSAQGKHKGLLCNQGGFLPSQMSGEGFISALSPDRKRPCYLGDPESQTISLHTGDQT